MVRPLVNWSSEATRAISAEEKLFIRPDDSGVGPPKVRSKRSLRAETT